MRYSRFMLAAAVLIFGSASVVSAQDWIKFAPEGGRFEVMLPGTPLASSETKDSAEGPHTTQIYIARSDDMLFMIAYVDYDPKFNFDVKAELQANKTNFLKPFNESKILTEKDIRFNASPGIEFAADLDATRTIVSRVFVVGRRPYQIVGVSPKGSDQTLVWKFLNSFKITRQ